MELNYFFILFTLFAFISGIAYLTPSRDNTSTLVVEDESNEKFTGYDNNDDKCHGLSQSQCLKQKGVCTWCVSGAIPSSCYTVEDAAKLPSGVFNCVKEDVFTDNESKNEEEDLKSIFIKDVMHIPKSARKSINNIKITLSPLTTISEDEPLCDPNVKQITGYFTIGKQNKHYFFWLFESRNKPSKDPISVWLNGGPGCSSMFGLFAENGPCSIEADGIKTRIRKESWNNNATILFIDQPPGTGYSYGTLDRDEKTIANDMLVFLLEFMNAHSEYKELPLYIFGESYAGHYIPSISARIYKYNVDADKNGSPKLNLKGIGIGNGLTDPLLQYPYYPEMGKNANILSDYQYQQMKSQLGVCLTLIKACNLKIKGLCLTAVEYCNSAMISPVELNGLNVYDYTKKCETNPPLCYDFSRLETFMNQRSVRKTLGIPDHLPPWVDCSNAPHSALLTDWMLSQADKISILVNAGIPVLIYAGDLDYICNYLGNEAWTKNLDWKGKEEFNKPTSQSPWKSYGILRKSGPLSFLQVFKAGHMVPMDQPKAGLEMFNDFVFKKGAWSSSKTKSDIDDAASTSLRSTKSA